MKVLTAKHWRKFKKTVIYENGTSKDIKDGSKFESLVKRLLDLEYGLNRWKSTGTTHDGSRDLEYRTKNSFKWAECKNYESGIALNVISNTLVMALIDFADEVLIFSYSKIKKPVLKKLIQYADVSQKILRIYADESLESLILKHIDSLKEDFFPSLNLSAISTKILPPFLSCNIIADPVTAYTMNFDMGNISKSPEEINFNSILCLCIAIYNPHIDKREISICIDWGKCNFAFEVLNEKYSDSYNISLEGNCTHIEKVFFHPIHYSEKFTMPYVLISYDGIKQPFTFPKVKCSWIGECILQGSSYQNIKKEFPAKVLNHSFFSAVHIHGTSGSGKSRMLAELQNVALGYGYRVVRFNIEDLETTNDFANRMITEFICSIYDIPDMNDFLETSDYCETNNICIMLANLIKKADLSIGEYEFILTNVLEKLQNSKCYISLDNIQYYPEQFANFLLDLLKRMLLSNNSCESRMGIVMNTDYLYYQSKHEELYSLLISSKDRIANYKLDGFCTDGEANLYLNQLLSHPNIKTEYIHKMLAASANNPYFIHSLLVSLETEGILIRQHDNYILPEDRHQEFCQKVEELKDINEILEKRWTYYIDKHDLEENLYIISALHIFQGLNNEIINSFSLSLKTIDELCKYHFLLKCGKLEFIYKFEHDLTEKFFSKKYFPLCQYACVNVGKRKISNTTFNNLKEVVTENSLSIEKYRLLWKLELPYKLGYEFNALLLKKIMRNIQTYSDIDNYLEMAFSIAASCRERYGTEAALALYDEIVPKISMDFPDYQSNINWAWAIASYCNVLYEHNEYQQASSYIKGLLQYMNKDESTYIRGYIYNRIHVYERATSETVLPQTYSWLKESENIQKKANIVELEFTNYIDRGYCNYYDRKHSTQLLDFWSKACDLYEHNILTSKKMNYFYHKIHVFMLKKQFNDALQMISDGQKAIINQEEGVYYITYFSERYILCEIACLLILNEGNNPKQINALFQQVEEYNYRLQSRSNYSIQFLKGIFCFYQKDFLNAILCLQKAKELLLNHKKLTFQKIYLEQLYQNVQYFTLQWQESQKEAITLDMISDSNIKRYMRNIIKMSIESRSKFIDSYTPTGVFQSNDGKINYPIL